MSSEISMRDVEAVFAGLEVMVDAPVWNEVSVPGAAAMVEPTLAEEEVAFRAFAALLGIEEEEPPARLVPLPTVEYEALLAEAAMLPDLLRLSERPYGWSDDEERECQAFLRQIGLR